MKLSGVWLPIITPFKDGKIDLASYKSLIDHYIPKGISGLVPLGTTGESPTIEEDEFEAIVSATMEYNNGRVPVYVGVGGNYTKKVLKTLKLVEKYKVDGILSVSPYYNRPDQNGIFEHFRCISESTGLDIIVYNIPYRTGRNIENETIHRLAELKNIVGIKDSSGDMKQTLALLLDPPKNFSILTGEDVLFYTTLTLGGHGGILASSHVGTESFIDVYNNVKANNHQGAFETWKKLAPFIPMLFEEPNPAPLKYYLHKHGLIQSPELRLPLTQISQKLRDKLDKII